MIEKDVIVLPEKSPKSSISYNSIYSHRKNLCFYSYFLHALRKARLPEPFKIFGHSLERNVRMQMLGANNNKCRWAFILQPRKVVWISERKDGYVPNVGTVSHQKGEEDPSITIQLYPEAKKMILVGRRKMRAGQLQDLSKINARRILGLYDVGTIKIKKACFCLSHNLRKEQLKQLDLELHSLKFIDKPHSHHLQDQEVDIDLWVPEDQIAFDIRKMASIIFHRTQGPYNPECMHSTVKGSSLTKRTSAAKICRELLMDFP